MISQDVWCSLVFLGFRIRQFTFIFVNAWLLSGTRSFVSLYPCVCTGFAFVYMDDDRDAEDAIRALDNLEFGRQRRRLRVEWAKVKLASLRRLLFNVLGWPSELWKMLVAGKWSFKTKRSSAIKFYTVQDSFCCQL